MRSLAVLLPFLLIIGCTNAHPTITRLFDIDGPKAQQSAYITNALPSIVDITGICFHVNSELMFSLDHRSWQPLSSILDTNQENDLNCRDGNFSVHVLSQSIGLTPQIPIVTIYLKQNFSGDESLESHVEIRYLNTIQAMLLNAPSAVTGLDANFNVGGVDVTAFKYKIGRSIVCEDQSNYSQSQSLGNLSLDLSSFGDGGLTLCLLGENPNQVQQDPTSFQWVVDSSIPGDIVLTNLPNAYDNHLNYSINVLSSNAVSYKAKLSTSSSDAIAVDENAQFSPRNKNAFVASICFRRFSRVF